MTETREEKFKKITGIRKEIDKTGDALGLEIDKGIKETVVLLKALGIPTTASCEGHTEDGLPWPWIEVASGDEPEERWEGQNSIFQKIGRKYGISADDVKKMANDEAWQEAMLESSKNPETKEYQKWAEENRKLYVKVSELLNEFYKTKDSKMRVSLEKFAGNLFRISCRGESEDITRKFIRDDITENEHKKINKKLPEKQAEMKEFTKFLENKYWG